MDEINDRTVLEIPDEIPAGGQDWANHIAHIISSNAQIQVVLEFEQHINEDLMKRAIRFSIDVEPVLGCRFMEETKPYWKRLSDIDNLTWCCLESTQNKVETLEKFLESPLEPEYRQLQAKIIRLDQNDLLCLKLDHACTDGGGVKQYVQLLADIYTHLSKDLNYRPISNRNLKRDASCLFEQLSFANPKAALNQEMENPKPSWSFPYQECPSTHMQAHQTSMMILRISGEKLAGILVYTKARQVTVNDLIMTLFYRALFAMVLLEPLVPVPIDVTVDLRRYLSNQKCASICNMSGIANTTLTRVAEEPFELTLKRVVQMMTQVKKNNPGIQSAVSMELMTGLSYQAALGFLQKAQQNIKQRGKCAPLLSNMGILAENPLRFGNHTVKDGYMITPAFHAPGFMLGVSTYHDTLTLVVSYYKSETRHEDVAKFLSMMESELTCASR